jgi:hypothetical protein
MRRQRAKSKPADVITPAALVEAMEAFGAEFRFTPAGSLIVSNLGKAPAELREMFFQCDGAQLVAFVRGRRINAEETGSGCVSPARGCRGRVGQEIETALFIAQISWFY